jgi:chitinase
MKSMISIKKITMLLALIWTGTVILGIAAGKHTIKAANYQCGTYFANWAMYNANLKNMNVGMIPWDQVTFINHAFYKVSSSYTLVSTDSWADEQASFAHSDDWSVSPRLAGHLAEYRYYKTIHPDVKVLISIGGWTAGENFHAMTSSPGNRSTFINSCVSFLKTYPFIDGLDIDWEYPGINRTGDPNDQYDHGCPGGPEDGANFTALLKELREAYNANGISEKLLTIAGPGGYDKVDLQQPENYHQYLDWINVMTYDMHGAWEKTTNLHAPLYPNPNDPNPTSPVDIKNKYNIDYIMQYYVLKGVPASKLNLGVPFYARGWKNVGTNGTNGLFAGADGAPVGNIDNPSSPGGQNTYPAVLALEGYGGFVKFRDSVNDAPYLYNASAGIFYTYDDEASLTKKCNYAKEHNYGGVFSWDIANDTSDFTLQKLLKSLMGGTIINPTPTSTSTATPETTPSPTQEPTSTPISIPTWIPNPTPTPGAGTPTPFPGISSWQSNTAYQVRSIVTYNGKYYYCRQAHTSQNGWEPPNVPALWQEMIVISTGRPCPTDGVAPTPPANSGVAWTANTAYKVGDVVTYNGKRYRCIQAHTSLIGWAPSYVPALWQAL